MRDRRACLAGQSADYKTIDSDEIFTNVVEIWVDSFSNSSMDVACTMVTDFGCDRIDIGLQIHLFITLTFHNGLEN